MFSPPVVSGHVLSPTRSSPATSPATSTSRGSRLRSLSYLKNYAHHLTGRDNNTASSSSSNIAFTNNGNNPSLSHRHAAATSPATSSATIPAAPNTATAALTSPASATAIDLSSSSHLGPSHPHSPTSASNALLSPSASSLSASHRISRSISNPLHGSVVANTAASTTITNATPVQQQQRPDHTEVCSTSGVTTATAAAVSTPGTVHLLSRVVSIPSTSSGPALQSVVESDVESPIFVSASPSPSASVAAMESIPEPTTAAVVSASANDTAPASSPAIAAPASSTDTSPSSHYSIRLTAYTDPRSTRQSLEFSTVLRKLPTGNEVLRVGRHSERENGRAVPSNVPSAAPIGFKSKVVSRRHCEFWCDEGKWYIKDVKSSSGTFLNHVRLSPPGQESKPWRVKDGDIIQLGIDFRGGEENMFRCVKMRVEVNRGWQNSANPFNTSAHERIRNLAKPNASSNSQDCTICLSRIAPCQTLFVAPCSHTWHFKCIKALLDGPSYPLFHCPNCRATTDLEAEPEEPEGWDMVDDAPAAADETTTMPTAPTSVAPVAAVDAQLDGTSSSNLGVAVTIPISTLAAAAATDATASATVADAAADDRILQEPAAATDVNGDVTMVLPAGALQSLSIDEQQLAGIQEEQGEAQISNAATPALSDVPASAPASTVSAGVPIPSPRTPSPGSQTGQDQVLTPRNHAGPWVFDGQALDASQGLTPLTSAMSDSGSGPMEVL